MADNKKKKESLPQESYETIDVNSADNRVNNDEISGDNALPIEQLSPDNMPDTLVLSQDSSALEEDRQIDDFYLPEISDKLYIPELEERYRIKRATLYKRMEYLEIAPWKDGKKAYLNAEQIGHMDGLHKHMKMGKEMDCYPKPEPTGPKEKSITLGASETTTEDDAQTSSAMTIPGTSAFQSASQPTRIQPTITATFSEADVEEAKISAQERVKAKRLAIIKIARAYEEDPNMLPPEVRRQIEEAEMAEISTPLSHRAYYDPNVLAQLAIQSM